MTSREKILLAVKNNQPAQRALPELLSFTQPATDVVEKYINILNGIGGVSHMVPNYSEIENIVLQEYQDAVRIISLCSELTAIKASAVEDTDPHSFENVDLVIMHAQFGVAENAAVWITDDMLPQRVLPFITQQMAVIIKKEDIVSTMHEAYDRIGSADYGFGTFIAGPSKTADIEQSLVLGAHGPKTMRVFIL
ncbi:MAG TPA: LUD domain-containing protein [Agriterribacter sp.]|nr:LUD domain-containing protein [Agriterribacter sp.]